MVDEQSFTSDLLPPLSSQLGPNSRSCSLSNDSLGHPCQSSFPPISSCLVSKALRDMDMEVAAIKSKSINYSSRYLLFT